MLAVLGGEPPGITSCNATLVEAIASRYPYDGGREGGLFVLTASRSLSQHMFLLDAGVGEWTARSHAMRHAYDYEMHGDADAARGPRGRTA